jgi:hypothetical protein
MNALNQAVLRSQTEISLHAVTANRIVLAGPPRTALESRRRFRCGSLLPATDSAQKYTIVYFLRQGCRRALVRWEE